jgi:hypothetical protein
MSASWCVRQFGIDFCRDGRDVDADEKADFSATTFPALVLMIMLTTFITPPLLKIVFESKRSGN